MANEITTPNETSVNSKFVHLHTHSHYSLLDGLSTPEELAKCAKDLGFTSLALTDHGSCAGLYNFQKACEKHGIKPILGMEGYISENRTVKEKGVKNHHILLLAKNEIGYRNLIALSSKAYLDGFYYKPRIDFELLKEHHEGLIVGSACSAGLIPFLLWNDLKDQAVDVANQYKDLFGDDFYIEIMMHTYNDSNKDQEHKEKKIALMLYELAKELDIKAICTQDIHYAYKHQWLPQDVLLAIQTRDNIKNENRMSFGSKDFYMKPYEEMAELYKKVPELLSNTLEIENKIETGIIQPSEDLLPHYDLPEGFANEEEYLKALVVDGMKQKGFMGKSEYRNRIKYEMGIIVECGFTKYFLALWDIINFARTSDLRVGIGRGSAVSSLCLYVLGITKLDPLKYDLIFERFLNPDRISPPDVDVDFDYYRREEIYDYIIRKYGADYCSKIGTFNTFKAKATIRATAKALDIGNDWDVFLEDKKKNPKLKKPQTKKSLDLADWISKQIPFKATTIEEALKGSKDFRNSMHRYPELLECARDIEGTISSHGIHPAGVVICKTPVIEQVPLRVKGDIITAQFDSKEVEKLGLLKFDLLALKTLTVVDRCLKMIKTRHNKDIDIDNLEPNDSNVFDILNGKNKVKDTKGIFQFEADGISKLLQNIRVDTFDDMIVANALYRPGPLGAGVHEMYCNYKHGRQEIKYLHPKMGEALQSTYGMMVFQENIMQVAVKLAGFTDAQSDTLRYAVGKKIPELLAQQKALFIDGCVKNDIDKSIAQKIFEQIDYFAGYGFNKSHSAAYAFLAYQTCWLKTYYHIEFMCNLLTSEINNNDKNEKLNAYIRAAAKMGVPCLKHDINRSGLQFKIEKSQNKEGKDVDILRSPFTILPGVGAKAVQNIVDNQPFANLDEFITKIDARVVNVRVFSTLVNSGCMDAAWGTSHKALLEEYPKRKKEMQKLKKNREKQIAKMSKFGTESLFGEEFDYSGKDLKF